MHQCQYCGKLLYAPLRFCSTEHAALFYQVSGPIAWASYAVSYEQRKTEWRKRKKDRKGGK